MGFISISEYSKQNNLSRMQVIKLNKIALIGISIHAKDDNFNYYSNKYGYKVLYINKNYELRNLK